MKIRYFPRFVFILLLLSSLSFSTELPIMATKQNIFNLRFVSNDGKFTYYQRKSGELILSTNFNIKKVIKSSKLTQYSIVSSRSRQKLIIVVDSDYHSIYNVRKLSKIYKINFGKAKATLIGKGVDPKLHLEDKWVSFYNPNTKIIHFKNLNDENIFYSLKLYNIYNPYFTPEIVMLNSNTIIYTDLSKKGVSATILFNPQNSKSTIIKKHDSNLKRIELCKNDNMLIVGSFGLIDHNPGSQINIYRINKGKLENEKLVYTSHLNDPGRIICSLNDHDLFFIKNTSKNSQNETSEAAMIPLVPIGEIDILSNLKHLTKIIDMDGKLLAQFRDKYYILIGENNLGEDKLKK